MSYSPFLQNYSENTLFNCTSIIYPYRIRSPETILALDKKSKYSVFFSFVNDK